jgi:hypothetical protein
MVARSAGSGVETCLIRLEARFQAFRAEVLKWQLEHVRYHREQESHWGIVQLMREHPFRTLVIGLLAGMAVAAVGSGPLEQWIMEWLR